VPDCYVLIGTEGGVACDVGLMQGEIRSLRYTYQARGGCGIADITARRDFSGPELKTLERLKTKGELAIFAEDPKLAANVHPWEPSLTFDDSLYFRAWAGRLTEVEADAVTGSLRLQAEGWVKALDAYTYFGAPFEGVTVASIITTLVSTGAPSSPITDGVIKTTAISTAGRMSMKVDSIDLDGQPVRDAIERALELVGPQATYGIDRNRRFWTDYRSNPFHLSGGRLEFFAGDTRLSELEVERSLARTKTIVRVFGAKDPVLLARPFVEVSSTLGISKFGSRREVVLRDDTDNLGILSLVGQAVLRAKNFAVLRARARLGSERISGLDLGPLPAVVLQNRTAAPESYASESRKAPNSPTGFAGRFTRASSQYALIFVPDTAPVPIPYHYEVVRKSASEPSVSQRFTIATASLNAVPGQPAWRLVEFNSAGTRQMLVEQWNGSTVVAVLTYAIPASLVGLTIAWGVSIDSSNRLSLFRDGTSVAGPTAGFSAPTAANLWALGTDQAIANFDDSTMTEACCWNTARTTSNFLSILGAHTVALRRFLGSTLRSYTPFWEGTGSTALTKGPGIGVTANASLVNGVTWVAGLVGEAGGGDLGPPLALDKKWGAGQMFGGSPIVDLEEIEREWTGDGGWRTNLEGGLASPSVARPLAAIEERLQALEILVRESA
jgi:hypothetical protein